MTPGVDLGQRPEPGHDPGQQQDRQVGLVLADAGIALRDDLVARRREAHDALAMDGAGPVDEAARQHERVFRPQGVGRVRADALVAEARAGVRQSRCLALDERLAGEGRLLDLDAAGRGAALGEADLGHHRVGEVVAKDSSPMVFMRITEPLRRSGVPLHDGAVPVPDLGRRR